MQYNILLVEDNETGGLLIASLFEENKNINIDIKVNGKDAINYLKNHKPDIVLLDIMLPDIDGFTILKQIRMHNATKDIPVVIISAKDRPEDIKKAKELGATDYVMKPVGINNLQERVFEILDI